MSEQLVKVSQESVQAQYNLQLMEAGLNKLQEEINALVFTPENLHKIEDTLKKGNKLITKVKAIHEEGKKPYLEAGRIWDAAKNDTTDALNATLDPAKSKYSKLVREIEEARKAEEAERLRKENIRTGIEKNILYYSKAISEATTYEELRSLENRINGEKGNKGKYAEFYDEAVEKYSAILNTTLKDQKQKVKELEAIEAEKAAALAQEDDAKVLELMQKQETLESAIEENKTIVQEQAVAELTKSSVTEAQVILPTVKPKYQKWKWEVVDIQQTAKKMKDWVTMEPNKEKIDDYLKGKKAEGIEGEEFEVAGIRFFLDKTYI